MYAHDSGCASGNANHLGTAHVPIFTHIVHQLKKYVFTMISRVFFIITIPEKKKTNRQTNRQTKTQNTQQNKRKQHQQQQQQHHQQQTCKLYHRFQKRHAIWNSRPPHRQRSRDRQTGRSVGLMVISMVFSALLSTIFLDLDVPLWQ